MKNNKRFLIATSDELTWEFDRPVIFLGTWCLKYDRKHIWQKLDSIIARPYGFEKKTKDSDNSEVIILQEKILLLLSKILNKFHKTKYSEKYWRILLQPWLRWFVRVVLNRTKTIEQCIKNYSITGINVYDDKNYNLAYPDTYSACVGKDNDYWNHMLNKRILELFGKTNFPLNKIKKKITKDILFKRSNNENNIFRKIIKYTFFLLKKFLIFFVRQKDALIITTYLPLIEQIKLELNLWQVPQMSKGDTKFIVKESPKKELRQDIKKQILEISNKKRESRLENILMNIISECLPVCFLEGFCALNKFVDQQPWPKKPKFIFTSNNYFFDEAFKLYTAKKVEDGVKYFVGQHGNNSGTHRYINNEVEELTAFKYLTWGWKENLSQHTPAFIMKYPKKNMIKHNSNGNLLLVTKSSSRCETYDTSFEDKKYLISQIRFIKTLYKDPYNNLTVRLQKNFIYLNNSQERILSELFKSVKIEKGLSPINKLIAKSKLIIFNYDSTGILEMLSQNVPTLAFWPGKLDHLRESAKPYYEGLISAKILHLTPESAAKQVNKIWKNVDQWWEKSEVQEARIKFCSKYARRVDNHIYNLMKILLNK